MSTEDELFSSVNKGSYLTKKQYIQYLSSSTQMGGRYKARHGWSVYCSRKLTLWYTSTDAAKTEGDLFARLR